MAKVLVNMEDSLYETLQMQEKSGVIGNIKKKIRANDDYEVVYKIRTSTGEVDELIKKIHKGVDNVIKKYDCVTLNNGKVGGLASLKEGDIIKYVVDDIGKKVYYVSKKSKIENKTVSGALQGGVDLEEGTITIKDAEGKIRTYNMRKSLFKANSSLGNGKNGNLVSFPTQTLEHVSLEEETVAAVVGMRAEPSYMEQVQEAKYKGYEGDACSDCGNFTMVRNGTCLKCITCGATSGCS